MFAVWILGIDHEDPPHRLCGHRKEMAASPELLISDQSQVRFMHEGGGAQSVFRHLRGHLRRSPFPQFVVEKQMSFAGGLPVTFPGRFNKAGYFSHTRESKGPGTGHHRRCVALVLNRWS